MSTPNRARSFDGSWRGRSRSQNPVDWSVEPERISEGEEIKLTISGARVKNAQRTVLRDDLRKQQLAACSRVHEFMLAVKTLDLLNVMGKHVNPFGAREGGQRARARSSQGR
jgi:hypothetical protein